jgi:hypothetical protein
MLLSSKEIPWRLTKEPTRLMDTTFHKIIFIYGLCFGIKILTANFSVKKAKLAKEKARRLSTHLFVNVQKKQTKNY